ncbi:unnamed protein product [Arabidopsis arenosa]|uniref:Uncharacterized protein n=1 Tax=Arabidopsis arenosa TaxID=38785 RepID=A0A8S1ZY79_ARAAE|nr:unnamed protein product [Arabidopsis arenosa]
MTSQACIPIHKKLKDLCKHHVDGFSAVLVHKKNIFKGLHWTSVVVELKLNCFVLRYFTIFVKRTQNQQLTSASDDIFLILQSGLAKIRSHLHMNRLCSPKQGHV